MSLVNFYFEVFTTLCPYCADFIVNHLSNVFQNGLIQILNLRLIPWGNALVQPDGSFLCQVQSTLFLFLFQFDFKFRIISQIVTVRCFYQHGPNECVLNTVDACTIAVYPDAVSESFSNCKPSVWILLDPQFSTISKSNANFELISKLFRSVFVWSIPHFGCGLTDAPVIDCYSNGLGKAVLALFSISINFIPLLYSNNLSYRRKVQYIFYIIH
ncbi:hypothetical protein LINPERHAP2_LOCUS8186 [Linum perenne]